MAGAIEHFFESLVEYQKRHLWLSLFLIFFATGVMLFFALNVKVDSSLDGLLIPSGDYLKYREVMSREFGQVDSVFIVVRQDSGSKTVSESFDLRNPKVFEALSVLEKSLLEEPEVKSVSSINSLFLQAFGRLPQTEKESREWVGILGNSANSFINKDFSATVMFVSVDTPVKTEEKTDFEKRIDEKVNETPFPAGTEAIATGFPKLLNRIISLMIHDSITTLFLSLGFVFVVLLFFFRKFSLSVIAIVPVVISTIWLAGSMALIGLKLSVANAPVAAMIIGLGVDYGIHIVNTFDNKVKKHERKPITGTMKFAGAALFVSFLTSFIGFAVDMLGTTQAIQSQGLTLTLGITFTY
ncbi:MAG: MMPL family transporter, partial [Candidatus Moranbacteria bacterium]|nr:MMPL family transporter [Candidatus Moranbacteria bacterium]